MNDVAILLVVLTALLAVTVVLAREVWILANVPRLYLRGRYADARHLCSRPLLLRVLPSVRNALAVTAASSLSMEGRWDEALAELDRIPNKRLDRNLRYVARTAVAGSLVLLAQDPERALRELDEANGIHTMPEDQLLRAHAELSLGNPDAAERAFRHAQRLKMPRVKLGIKNTLVFDHEAASAAVAALQGWYLVRVERASEARELLSRAVSSVRQTGHVALARSLLERLGPDSTSDDDGDRGSLAPQVLP